MAYRDCFQHLYGIERKRIPATPQEDLRLHRLERPVAWSDDLMDEIWHAQYPINQYPDYAAFYEELADFVGVPRERIVVGAGIEDFIRSLMLLSLDPGDAVAFPWPTCAMFEIYARVFRARPVKLVTFPGCHLPAERICEKLHVGCKLLILPNPGQPVETVYTLDDLRLIATRCIEIGAVFAVDEAYYGFGAATSINLLAEYDNLVVMRTFSKAFGAAGIRVGYAIGRPNVIKPLDAIRESGEIAGPSLTAATVLMRRWDTHIRPGIAEIVEGRNWLRIGLRRLGYEADGHVANHVLVRVDDAKGMAARLKAQGVHVRGGFSAPLDQHLLVTAGPIALMREFYSAFKRESEKRARGA